MFGSFNGIVIANVNNVAKPIKYIQPQKGYQEKALSCEADILISGGSAGPGKTFALLLESVRNINNKNFGGVIFRRTSPQIRSQGGLWDTSFEVYPVCKAIPKETVLEWDFPSGAKIKFSHLQYEKDIYDWQGSQIPFIGFDELTHFTESMFFYLLSRNRSTCGVKPYVRATCNPDPDSWVAKLIEWWIDSETGFPIPERDGVVRYFIKYGKDYIWGDSYAEVEEKAAHILADKVGEGLIAKDFIKSISFINGKLRDNKILMEKDPGYMGNLLSQDEQTRMQLMDGNWKVVISENDIYNYPAFTGMFDNVKDVNRTGRYITADIALQGSNKFVVGVWEGLELIDVEIMGKSDGPEVIALISRKAKEFNVENRYICYDNDGIGGFVDGYIRGSVPFNGGTPAREMEDETSGVKQKENYFNLKTQCYYRSGQKVNRGEMKISRECGEKMYNDKMTVRQRFTYERRAIKRDKADMDGKLKIIPKEQMKVILGGDSPDLMDMFMMRELFELTPRFIFSDAG